MTATSSMALSWNAVTNAHRYRLERAMATSGPWAVVGDELATTTRAVTGLACGTTYHFRVSARGDGTPYDAKWGAPSGTLAAGTPCVSASASGNELFVGQSATLTATVTGAPGGVSYRWQKWTSGAWTNLAATSKTHSVRSATTSVSFFRFAVSYPSGGGSAASGVVGVRWRPMVVALSASPEFPLSASTTRRTVTLTATSTAPSGVSYQWQQGSGSGWTDLGATTTSLTRDVSYTTRGTRKFRVVASHATAASATSEPVYVTWDEWAIVGEMIGKLSDAVATSTAYKTAQTSLVGCMNLNATSTAIGSGNTKPIPVTYATFDDILARYTGNVKVAMEAGGACASQSSTMFSTNASTTRAELAKLKAGNAVYAALLDTPYGKQFEASVGANHVIKQFANLKAHEPSATVSSGVSGDSPLTGLDCLPSGGNKPATLDGMLDVLNCLAFDTPYDFWVSSAESLKIRIDSPNRWLGYGDWKCTFPAWQGPVPACLKHDVVYGSLQKFSGDNSGIEDSNSLDKAWNPRNKHLADAVFLVDIIDNGCQLNSGPIAEAICLLDALHVLEQGTFMQWGVNRVNNKGWPVTTHDMQHSEANQGYVACDVPRVSDVQVTTHYGLLTREFRSNWTYRSGCVSGITVNRYRICWDTTILGVRDNVCEYPSGDSTTGKLTQPSLSIRSVKSLSSISIRPNDIEYGGLLASGLLDDSNDVVETLRWLDEISLIHSTGIFYPEQHFDLRY